MSWSRRFEDPIKLPDGRTLVTLKDAADYIRKLPAKESKQKHWQTAVRELLICADRKGVILMAQIAMNQALHHGEPEPPKEPRRKRAKKFTILK